MKTSHECSPASVLVQIACSGSASSHPVSQGRMLSPELPVVEREREIARKTYSVSVTGR